MLTIFLMITVLLLGKISTVPFDPMYMDGMMTSEEMTTGEMTTEPTTTTTLPPEIDREWEDLVLAGPAVVNYLSLFMVFASRKDEALTPSAGYNATYIANAYSLRQTLLQISSSMEAAFKLGRDDLVRVQDGMSEISEHIKAALLVIKSAPDNLLNELLPYTLRNVARAAKEGSTVSKPVLDRFISVGLLLKELCTLADYSVLTYRLMDYFTEAKIYAYDMKTQWNLLVKLFRKFSERAIVTEKNIQDSFIDPIKQAQEAHGFNSSSNRSDQLSKLNSIAISIDQSSYLLEMMVDTYMNISQEHMVKDITSINSYLSLSTEPIRITKERELWQSIVSQSVKIARLAQEQHNKFVGSGLRRQAEYDTYLRNALAA